MTDHDPAPKTQELHTIITVEGRDGKLHPGREYAHGPVSGDSLTHRAQSDRSYQTLDIPPLATNIVLAMDNGDTTLITVENPEETDNLKRNYFLTSLSMQRANSDGKVQARKMSHEDIRDMQLDTNEPVIYTDPDTGQSYRSEGCITGIVTYDRTRELASSLADKYPRKQPQAEFLRAVATAALQSHES